MHRGRIVSPECIYGKLILQIMCGNGNLCRLSHSPAENCTLQVCQPRLSDPTAPITLCLVSLRVVLMGCTCQLPSSGGHTHICYIKNFFSQKWKVDQSLSRFMLHEKLCSQHFMTRQWNFLMARNKINRDRDDRVRCKLPSFYTMIAVLQLKGFCLDNGCAYTVSFLIFSHSMTLSLEMASYLT